MSVSSVISRLSDPYKTVGPKDLEELRFKISSTITNLCKRTDNGGNPFLFSYCAAKMHYLASEAHGQKIETAATDGKSFFWNADFLKKLSPLQTSFVMQHETVHVCLFHCSIERSSTKNNRVWGVSVDYVANSVSMKSMEQAVKGKEYLLFTEPLGQPYTLKEMCEWLDGTVDTVPEKVIFFDKSLYGISSEEIYDRIMNAELNSPRRCKEYEGGCGALTIDPKTGISKFGAGPHDPPKCPKCGAQPNYSPWPGTIDSHMSPQVSREALMAEIVAATESTKLMRGTVPAEIDAIVKELGNPELSVREVLTLTFSKIKKEGGERKDYSRYRKRYLGMEEPLYIPRTFDLIPKWVVLLDTSGSMSDDDIANGLKEVKVFGNNTDGYIVPCDAKPYWDKATKINNMADVTRTKIVGRGGTVFDEFFRDYQKNLGKDFSLVCIITDGDCGTIPTELRPAGSDVLWIITNNRDFKPTFGRVVNLKRKRMLFSICLL